MKARFFQKLAFNGIQKNGKLYRPYLFVCSFLVTILYVLKSMTASELLSTIPRNTESLTMLLNLGMIVVGIFAFLFLAYTNSFLMRARKKELGLYHVLGMGRKGLRKIIFWETILCALIGLGAGLAGGIVFSKLAEILLGGLMQIPAGWNLFISFPAMLFTAVIYLVIFLFLLIRNLISVQKTKPVEMLKGESLGEKAPKANWIIALIGAVLLSAAYAISLSLPSPSNAVVPFFGAVVMVVIAAYLIFMAGSVALCKVLQSTPGYYFKKNHFVSVSSMAFRMKRNGASLASICILSTMVLVMIASTCSFYFGYSSKLSQEMPKELTARLISFNSSDCLEPEKLAAVRGYVDQKITDHQLSAADATEYQYAAVSGLMEGNKLDADPQKICNDYGIPKENLAHMVFVPAEEYNRVTGENLQPQPNQAYIFTKQENQIGSNFEVGGKTFEVAGKLPEGFPLDPQYNESSANTVLAVVNSMDTVKALNVPADEMKNGISYHWSYSLNLPQGNQEQIMHLYEDLHNQFSSGVEGIYGGLDNVYPAMADRTETRVMFLSAFGALLFIGIILSIVFIMAAIIIIYYKQISEGYEDQDRFKIMKKVGMTSKDIKASINSQMLTVFFAPLLLAGLNLFFAFPFVLKFLRLLGLTNSGFCISVAVLSFAGFGLVYSLIYKMTAGSYYRIVNA